MDRWVGKVAIVTGASAGIGAAIAEDLAKAGVVVVGLARRLERLEELSANLKKAKGKLYARQCDVSKEDDILNAFKWVNAELGGVDILVNNAGLISSKKIIDDDSKSYRNILDVNVLAMAIATREAVASMKSRGVAGYIINVNSIYGHTIPSLDSSISLYPASKYAVTALTETVRKELSADPNNAIRISSVSPGVVRTEVIEVSGATGVDKFYEENPYLDSKDISDAVLYLLETRQMVQVTELTIRPINERV